MRSFILAISIIFISYCAAAGPLESAHSCDKEFADEVGRVDSTINDMRENWYKAVNDKLASANLSDEKRIAVEGSYTTVAVTIFNNYSQKLQALERPRMPLILPLYDSSICTKFNEFKAADEKFITAYEVVLRAVLHGLDNEINSVKND